MLLIRNLLSQLDVPPGSRIRWLSSILTSEQLRPDPFRRSQRRRGHRAAFYRANSNGPILGSAVLAGRRAEDYLRPLDLRGVWKVKPPEEEI